MMMSFLRARAPRQALAAASIESDVEPVQRFAREVAQRHATDDVVGVQCRIDRRDGGGALANDRQRTFSTVLVVRKLSMTSESKVIAAPSTTFLTAPRTRRTLDRRAPWIDGVEKMRSTRSPDTRRRPRSRWFEELPCIARGNGQ